MSSSSFSASLKIGEPEQPTSHSALAAVGWGCVAVVAFGCGEKLGVCIIHCPLLPHPHLPLAFSLATDGGSHLLPHCVVSPFTVSCPSFVDNTQHRGFAMSRHLSLPDPSLYTIFFHWAYWLTPFSEQELSELH